MSEVTKKSETSSSQMRLLGGTPHMVYSIYVEQCIYSIHMQYSFVVYLLNHICSVSTGFCKTAFKILYQIRQNVVHIYISIYSNEQDVLRLRGLFQLSQAGV